MKLYLMMNSKSLGLSHTVLDRSDSNISVLKKKKNTNTAVVAASVKSIVPFLLSKLTLIKI